MSRMCRACDSGCCEIVGCDLRPLIAPRACGGGRERRHDGRRSIPADAPLLTSCAGGGRAYRRLCPLVLLAGTACPSALLGHHTHHQDTSRTHRRVAALPHPVITIV